ncbi:MAG: tail fiber domain-containing protein [Halieaceae bacterium]
MSKDKIADYDGATAGNNTDIGGISIDEGMLPSTVNNSMRELTRQLGAFADGTDGIDVLNLHDDDASASIKIQAPATVTTTTTFTLPDGDGTSGYALVTNGSGQLSWASAAGIGNVVEDTSPQLGGDLQSNGNDIVFADDDKAIFGAGSDLQIYHASDNHSNIRETGSGNLQLWGSNTNFLNTAGSKYHATFADGGAVTLYNDGAAKLATTSSGVDVTGGLNTTGNVGIGTASPTLDGSLAGLSVNGSGTVLHVNDGDGATLKLTDPATGANRGLGITLQGTSAAISNCESGELRFGTGNTERMRLDDSGNLLIGNSTFGAEDGVYISQGGNYVWARSDDTSGYFDRTGADGTVLELRKNGTTTGRIVTDAGDLTIGTGACGLRFLDGSTAIIPRNTARSTSNGALDLGASGTRFNKGFFNDSLRTRYFIGIDDTNTYIEMGGSDVMKFVTGGGERGRFDSSGNFLIGTTNAAPRNFSSSTYGIRFIGDQPEFGIDTAYFNKSNGAGTLINLRQSGTDKGTIAVSSSGTTYNTTSDIRLKQDIEPLEATNKLMAMNPVSYSWKADPDGPRSMGFIAQEMEEVMPEAVSTGDDDDAMMSMDYGRITPILVSALQDAHRKIEQLEQRIADMEAN